MNGRPNSKLPYHDPYAKLAAAILDSGKRCNDTVFLESDWADILREMCRLDNIIYGNKNIISLDTRLDMNSAHIGRDDA